MGLGLPVSEPELSEGVDGGSLFFAEPLAFCPGRNLPFPENFSLSCSELLLLDSKLSMGEDMETFFFLATVAFQSELDPELSEELSAEEEEETLRISLLSRAFCIAWAGNEIALFNKSMIVR